MQNNDQNPYAASQVREQSISSPQPALSASESLPPLPGGWLVVGLLWLVGCLNYLDRNMVMTMHDSLTSAFKIDEEQFSLITSVFLWSYGAFSPLGGFLADRFSKSKVIIGSLLVWSAVTFWTGHVGSFNEMLIARACMGISEACYIPAALALIADYHRGSTRSLATGIQMSGINFGGAMGGLGGVIAYYYYWNTPFVIFGGIGIGYSVMLLLCLRDAPVAMLSAADQQGSQKQTVSFINALERLFSNRNYWLLLIFWSILGFAGWVLNKWMPTYVKETFSLNQASSGMLVTVCLQGSSMFGVIAGGAWADRLSRTNPRGRIIVPVIGLLIATLCVFLSANSLLLVPALAGLIGYGLARIFCDANVMPILCQIADSRYRATGYGILNMFSCFFGGFGVYLGGWLRDHDVKLTFIFNVSAVIVLICAFVISRIRLSSPATE